MENEVVEAGQAEGTQNDGDDTGNLTDGAEGAQVDDAGKKDGDDGKKEEGKVEDLESVKTERDTANKRLSDKDSHITTLERENATLRKGKQATNKESAELSARFPKEAAEIAQLRLDGKDLEADELSAQVRVKVYEDKVAFEQDARATVVNESQNRNNYRDFDKYKEAVEKGLKEIPLDVLKKNPDFWVEKEYNAAVGADYLSLKEKSKGTGKVDAGGGQSSISGSPESGEKSESENITQGIADAFPKEGI